MSDKKKLVSELISLRKKENEVREKIAKIEADEKESKIIAMIGKCYALRFDHYNEDDEVTMFGRVEEHCQDGRKIVGTQISIYRTDPEDVEAGVAVDGDFIEVELNSEIFESYIDNGYEITTKEFNGYLQEAIDGIKLS